MTDKIAWINTAQDNPDLALQYGRKPAPLSLEGTVFSAMGVDAEPIVDTAPIALDQLYYPGPQGETFMFWGVMRPSALALYQMPAGNIIYYTVPKGKVAHVKRVQMINTGDSDVTVEFLVGDIPFQEPRLDSRFVIPAMTGDYDLACDFVATEGEHLAFIMSEDRKVIGAITGHVEDAFK